MDANQDDVTLPWEAGEEYADEGYWHGSGRHAGYGRGREWGHGSESERIKWDIDRTRGDMDRTIRELRSRMSPRHLMHRVKESFGFGEEGAERGPAGDALRSAGRGIADTVRDHPIPLALIGAGLAWMAIEQARGGGRGRWVERGRHEGGYGERDWLSPGAEYEDRPPEEHRRALAREWEARRGPGLGARAREKAGAVRERAGEAIHEAEDVVSRTMGRVRERISGVGGSVREGASHLRERASHVGERVSRRAHEAQEGFWERYDEYPLGIGAAALLLGLLGGMSVPTTRAEDRVMGDASDELKRRARRVGRQAVEGTKEVARNVADAVSDETSRPGNVASKVRNAATSGIDAAIDETRRQARNVKESLPRRDEGRPGPT